MHGGKKGDTEENCEWIPIPLILNSDQRFFKSQRGRKKIDIQLDGRDIRIML